MKGAIIICNSMGSVTELCMIWGGDSTVSNTGWKEGAIANLEKLFVHQCYCNWMLHTNEFDPFRHLIVGIDGATTSSIVFLGHIGKLLGSVNEMECQPKFKALPGGEDLIILPKNVLYNMSTDQQLSYKLCNKVKYWLSSIRSQRNKVWGFEPFKIAYNRNEISLAMD